MLSPYCLICREAGAFSLSFSKISINCRIATYSKLPEVDINCPGATQTTLEDNSFRIDRTSEDNSFRILFTVLELADIHSSSRGAIGFPNVLKGYKFLKAEQESLDEVVNLSKFGKSESQSQPNIMTLYGMACFRIMKHWPEHSVGWSAQVCIYESGNIG